MKNLILSIALSLVAASAWAGTPANNDRAPQTQPPASPPVLWSNTVTCSVISFSYFDFTKTQPFQNRTDFTGSMSTTLTMAEYTLGSGSIEIPGTQFSVDIHGLQYSNSIKGQPTDHKTLFGNYILRQNGKVVAAVQVQEGAPASYALLLANATLIEPVTMEASVQRDVDIAKGNLKPLAAYVRRLDSAREVIADSITVSCAVQKK